MSDRPIAAVLLVPEAGDPLGLLAEGPCGSRPPLAMEKDGYRWLDYACMREVAGM